LAGLVETFNFAELKEHHIKQPVTPAKKPAAA
jgi:hypothetical protein